MHDNAGRTVLHPETIDQAELHALKRALLAVFAGGMASAAHQGLDEKLVCALIDRWAHGGVGFRFEIVVDAAGLFLTCGTDAGLGLFDVAWQPGNAHSCN